MTDVFADRELTLWVATQPPYVEPDVTALRSGIAARARDRPREVEMRRVVDLSADGVPVRLYLPSGGDPSGLRGLLVYLHGGGWTIGSIDGHDAVVRRLADGAGVRVLSVDYRLAPENPWPASVDDAVTVLRWVAGRPAELLRVGDGSADELGPVGVGGDSAGGLLAALACQRLRELDPAAMPDAQVLLYPNTDLAADTESLREKGVGFGLDSELVHWFARQWVPDPARWSDPAVSPLRADDLSGLPSALVITAEHDALRDEGEAYARRLAAAGVTTTLRRDPGVVHNAVMLGQVSPACAACLQRLIADVARLLR